MPLYALIGNDDLTDLDEDSYFGFDVYAGLVYICKANGKQREYDEWIKSKKHKKMEENKVELRADDMVKGLSKIDDAAKASKFKGALDDIIKGQGQGDVKWTNHGYKHTPEKNKSWKDIKKSTKSGPAKYHPDIKDIEAFERNAWKIGKQTTNGKNWKTKKYNSIIGTSEGKETTYVHIENSADTIHGHPITKQEYDKLNKKQ